MLAAEVVYLIISVEGSVRIYDHESGWSPASVGMTLSEEAGATIKTGSNACAVTVNTRGELMTVPACSTKIITANPSDTEMIDTLRRMELFAPGRIIRLVPAA